MATKPTMTDAAEPDPYAGVGGSYVLDPRTGRRVQVVAPPDAPQVAPPPSAAGVQTSALDAPAAAEPSAF